MINTGYLYLLFFGFQEIQSLERDAHESSPVPVVSWIKKGYTLSKARYLGVAMILTVVITAAINIFYGLAVFAAHPNPAAVLQAQIPALYLASTFLGPGQELLVGIAFLIATVTTFVPAFLAATRHLAALGEDGYMPRSLASLSWLFTLVSIFLLAVGNENFLVEITDFMVLASLGIITLSAVWLRRSGGRPMGGPTSCPSWSARAASSPEALSISSAPRSWSSGHSPSSSPTLPSTYWSWASSACSSFFPS